jgi:hypothetical protein
MSFQLQHLECFGLLGGERRRQCGAAQYAGNNAGQAQRHGSQCGLPRIVRLALPLSPDRPDAAIFATVAGVIPIFS